MQVFILQLRMWLQRFIQISFLSGVDLIKKENKCITIYMIKGKHVFWKCIKNQN